MMLMVKALVNAPPREPMSKPTASETLATNITTPSAIHVARVETRRIIARCHSGVLGGGRTGTSGFEGVSDFNI